MARAVYEPPRACACAPTPISRKLAPRVPVRVIGSSRRFSSGVPVPCASSSPAVASTRANASQPVRVLMIAPSQRKSLCLRLDDHELADLLLAAGLDHEQVQTGRQVVALARAEVVRQVTAGARPGMRRVIQRDQVVLRPPDLLDE